jgi:hypothetical protein
MQGRMQLKSLSSRLGRHLRTASLEKPEGGEQHWKKKAEKFIERIGDLEQAVEKYESQDESM